MSSKALDAQDIRILELLQQDATLTSQQIAEAVNMSQSPCWRRINRLQEQGFIAARTALLDRQKLGMEVITFTTVNLAAQSRADLEAFESRVVLFPEVLECYTMTGIWDYMLKVVTRDIRHYEIFVREHLMSLEHIGEVHSHIAVTEIKNSTALPLTTQL